MYRQQQDGLLAQRKTTQVCAMKTTVEMMRVEEVGKHLMGITEPAEAETDETDEKE